jgi:hypothetical protein
VAPPTAAQLRIICREAIDAGAPASRSTPARAACVSDASNPRAVLAAVEAAATGDRNRRHDDLRIALEQGLRPHALDALGRLAVAASQAQSWAESVRLLAAADRLRDEAGYRWRFRFEQQAVAAALAAAREALGEDADAATAQGRSLDLRDVATHQHVARPRRGRRGSRG